MRINPWRIPPKRPGQSLKKMTFKIDPDWLEAIRYVANQENELYESKISMPTIIQDLSSRNGTYFVDVRKKVNERYKQIKRERTDEQNSKVNRRN